MFVRAAAQQRAGIGLNRDSSPDFPDSAILNNTQRSGPVQEGGAVVHESSGAPGGTRNAELAVRDFLRIVIDNMPDSHESTEERKAERRRRQNQQRTDDMEEYRELFAQANRAAVAANPSRRRANRDDLTGVAYGGLPQDEGDESRDSEEADYSMVTVQQF